MSHFNFHDSKSLQTQSGGFRDFNRYLFLLRSLLVLFHKIDVLEIRSSDTTFQLPLNLFNAGKAGLQLVGQGRQKLVFGDSNRLVGVAQGIKTRM